MNREVAELILAEAAAAGRDTTEFRGLLATYESRRLADQPVVRARMSLLRSGRELGKQSSTELRGLQRQAELWAGEDRRRLLHLVVVQGRLNRQVGIRGGRLTHTIHWKVVRTRRWLTLLGLTPSLISPEPGPGSTSP